MEIRGLYLPTFSAGCPIDGIHWTRNVLLENRLSLALRKECNIPEWKEPDYTEGGRPISALSDGKAPFFCTVIVISRIKRPPKRLKLVLLVFILDVTWD